MSEKNNTTKAISAVTILLVVTKLMGFVREMVIASFFGATYQTDAYNMAVGIPNVFTIVVSAGIAAVFIPLYNKKKVELSKESADLFASNLFWFTTLLFGIISIIGIVTSPLLVSLLAPNFSYEAAKLTVTVVRILFVFLLSTNITNVLTSVLQIYNKFAITIIATFPFSIFTILFIIAFYEQLGIFALVISFVLFWVVQALILFFSAKKVFKLSPILSFTNGEIKQVIILSLPVYLGVAAWEVNIVVDRIIASGLPAGSITAMNFAHRLRELPNGIITAAVLTVVFPLLSKYAANKDISALKALTTRTMTMLVLTFTPIVAIGIYYPVEITGIVFERGAFTSDDTALTASIFIFFIASLVFTSCITLINNAFISMQNTLTPQIGSVVMIAINITLNIVFVQIWGAPGLALATLIAFFVNFVLIFVLFRLKVGSFGGLALLKNVSKCVLAALCMVPVFLLFEYLREGLPLLIFFALASIVSLGVYALVLYLLKVELFTEMAARALNIIKSRLKIARR